MIEYEHDAWGNMVGGGFKKTFNQPTSIGEINSFRYRSYFYDTDTGLYYLQSRYYDPAICRFISPDSFEYANPNMVNGLNLYAYCNNNPVVNIDPEGTSVLSLFIKGIKRIVKYFTRGLKSSAETCSVSVDPPDFGFDISIGSQSKYDELGSLIADISNSLAVATAWIFLNNNVLRGIYSLAKNDPETAFEIGLAIYSIGGGVISFLGATGVISISLAGEVALAVSSIGLGIYSLGKALKWW